MAVATRLKAPVEKIALLVLQPTPFCNINCKYCYLPNRDDRSRMSFATLRSALSKAAEADRVGDSLSIVWHAGEPLVMPSEWYAEAFGIVAEILPDVNVEHHFQTNGLLIDDPWCDFFRQTGARVGVSIDGPAALHDASRQTRNGMGTHQRVVAGIRRLQQAQITSHAICVLTRDHLDHADAVFDFFVDLGVKELGFNIDEIDGVNRTSSLQVEDAVTAFSGFFRRIVDRYRRDPDLLAIPDEFLTQGIDRKHSNPSARYRQYRLEWRHRHLLAGIAGHVAPAIWTAVVWQRRDALFRRRARTFAPSPDRRRDLPRRWPLPPILPLFRFLPRRRAGQQAR
jgi:sulfatase maturation enzyme AslB (radical SAM superfamily)